jgi:hypothetical protein
MRDPNPFYALGKLADVVRTLAREPYEVGGRLLLAFHLLRQVRADDLPPMLRKDLEWVREMLTTKRGQLRQEDAVLKIIRGMPRTLGKEIAERLLNIESRLRWVLYDERPRGKRAIAARWRLERFEDPR